MKVVDRGHRYLLDQYDTGGQKLQHVRADQQPLAFMKRIGLNYPGNEGRPHEGTNMQEVLRALIDRAIYVNNQIPCAETEGVINSLRNAMLLLEIRAARMHGATLSLYEAAQLERITPCFTCGHVRCGQDHPHWETKP